MWDTDAISESSWTTNEDDAAEPKCDQSFSLDADPTDMQFSLTSKYVGVTETERQSDPTHACLDKSDMRTRSDSPIEGVIMALNSLSSLLDDKESISLPFFQVESPLKHNSSEIRDDVYLTSPKTSEALKFDAPIPSPYPRVDLFGSGNEVSEAAHCPEIYKFNTYTRHNPTLRTNPPYSMSGIAYTFDNKPQACDYTNYLAANSMSKGVGHSDRYLEATAAYERTHQQYQNFETDGQLFPPYAMTHSPSLSPYQSSPSAYSSLTRHGVAPRGALMTPSLVVKNDYIQQQKTLNKITALRRSQMGFNPQNLKGPIYKVQFKRKYRYFTLGVNAPRSIVVSDFVKVEADRGEGLGVVHSILSPEMYWQEVSTLSTTKEEEGSREVKQIIRLASTYERRQLPGKYHDEAQVLQSCLQLNNIYALPMTIVDVEFQFDRHKLTVYYDSPSRIDFREFVRDLFAVYKTRIWMQHNDAYFMGDAELAFALNTGNYAANTVRPPVQVVASTDYAYNGLNDGCTSHLLPQAGGRDRYSDFEYAYGGVVTDSHKPVPNQHFRAAQLTDCDNTNSNLSQPHLNRFHFNDHESHLQFPATAIAHDRHYVDTEPQAARTASYNLFASRPSADLNWQI